MVEENNCMRGLYLPKFIMFSLITKRKDIKTWLDVGNLKSDAFTEFDHSNSKH